MTQDLAGSAVGPGALAGALTALRQAPIGVAIFDREMRYLAASVRYLTDQGLPGDTALIGQRHYDVFPHVPQHWRDLHASILVDGRERCHHSDCLVQPNGKIDWIRWLMTPWRDDEGNIGGLVLYAEYVTQAVEDRHRLETAEARYRAVFDQAAVGVALVSPKGLLLEVNDGFCTIVRYDRAELVGLSFQDITHPEDLEADMARVDSLLAGEIETFSMEKRYLDKMGACVWAELTVSLVRQADGQPDYFVSVIEDIGARKQAESVQIRHRDQLKLLINELNHRVKNTLATVQSMAAQTLRHEREPQLAYEKFEARLVGLSEAHDVLTRESWHGAALREVAERALRPFTQASLEQLRIEGGDVWLQPAAALTLSLVFHELATNAVKYGALSVDSGHVDLAWRSNADETISITWRETGGPVVTAPTRRGFGSRLVQGALRGDLRGDVDMSFAPEGFACAMQMRLTPGV